MNAPYQNGSNDSHPDRPAQSELGDADMARLLGLDGAGEGPLSARRLIALGLAGLAALALVYWLVAGGEQAVRYTTEAARRGGLEVTVTATGTVEPTNKVEISSELSGIIETVRVDYNDQVTTGEVLAELDTEQLAARVALSRATLETKRAKLAEAEATLVERRQEYDRIKPLAARNVASTAALDAARAAFLRAEAAVAVAQADVAVGEASLQVDESNLAKAKILSPIDGVVLSRDVDPGQTVAASLQAPILFTLAEDLAEMQLEVDVDEADVGKVREGQSASFTVEAYQDRRFDAKLTEVRFAPEIIDGVVTYTAILTLDNADLLLRPGMTATADIIVQEVEDALLIPNAALRYVPPDSVTGGGEAEDEAAGGGVLSRIFSRPRGEEIARIAEPASGERTVWLLRDGVPEAVAIRIGASDGAWTEVRDGPLATGDALITDSEIAE